MAHQFTYTHTESQIHPDRSVRGHGALTFKTFAFVRRHHTHASAISATAQGEPTFDTQQKIIFSKHTNDQILRRRNPHPCLLRQHYFPTLPCSARPPAGSCQGASGNQRLTVFIWLYSFDGETLEYAAVNPGSIFYRKQPLLSTISK